MILRSRRVATTDGIHPAAIHVAGGRIESVLPYDTVLPDEPCEDVGDDVVFPGLVDTHVHVNDPGRTHWEGFAHATRAAAAGGITTIVDMPLNSTPATTTCDALAAKVAAADGASLVDYAFWGGVVPGNRDALASLWRAGVLGFKCFLVDSGVDDFRAVTQDELSDALAVLAPLNAPLLVHAEAPERVKPAPSSRRYADYLASRPQDAEVDAIRGVITAAERHGASVHVVHLAAPNAFPDIERARERGVRLSVETCPHYLVLCAEEIADGQTVAKCAPPIRGADERQGLWRGLLGGTIDFVASDHSPCPPEKKALDTGDFGAAWGGIASLQLMLPLVWTGARSRHVEINRLLGWLADRPARRFGLAAKGRIEPGFDADLVVWRPEASFVVEASRLHHRHPLGPHEGRELFGVVERTYLRGHLVYDAGRFDPRPSGRWLPGAGA
jgi:allantoinase